jgi:hypothetical protein
MFLALTMHHAIPIKPTRAPSPQFTNLANNTNDMKWKRKRSLSLYTPIGSPNNASPNNAGLPCNPVAPRQAVAERPVVLAKNNTGNAGPPSNQVEPRARHSLKSTAGPGVTEWMELARSIG